MSVDRSKRLNRMFAPPKKIDLPAGDPPTPTDETIKDKNQDKGLIDLTKKIIKTEDDQKKIDPDSENSLIDPLKEKTKGKIENNPPLTDTKNKKEKHSETTKLTGVYINCRASSKMKSALEDMAKDFAYMARKKYGLKIKDDSSSIQRAFLILGMSLFTEKVRHKILQEYDSESPMQDEVLQQLVALMRIHNVEVDDYDL